MCINTAAHTLYIYTNKDHRFATRIWASDKANLFI